MNLTVEKSTKVALLFFFINIFLFFILDYIFIKLKHVYKFFYTLIYIANLAHIFSFFNKL